MNTSSYVQTPELAESAEPAEGCASDVVDAGRVALAAEHLPRPRDVADTADVFSLLGDPNRLTLLLALLEGELCVHDLAALTGQSDSSTSHALKLLRAHRVVATRRDGRRMFYRLDDPHVRMLLDLAVAHTAHTEQTHPEITAAGGGGA
ncbi:ArsR/SmtB family transcription factor [Brachybacterium kimchii]|uniref:Metalloregulator ArsR/SmtB family transcription factor n=1 Tax=Brachybacterium kimchii TaxID=2942909 RepID=A0ABY4NCR7_9MICO|nr:metalloregulator ArsR/SmtB family transcription factor [Brachybacterium kimchii]UQN31358.1 metalloregulator ArsR/SmtB family transcription factor [Brachybacterium kimchii]